MLAIILARTSNIDSKHFCRLHMSFLVHLGFKYKCGKVEGTD